VTSHGRRDEARERRRREHVGGVPKATAPSRHPDPSTMAMVVVVIALASRSSSAARRASLYGFVITVLSCATPWTSRRRHAGVEARSQFHSRGAKDPLDGAGAQDASSSAASRVTAANIETSTSSCAASTGANSPS